MFVKLKKWNSVMRSFVLNKLNSLNSLKFLQTKSIIKRSSVKKFQSTHVRETYRELAKRTFSKTVVIFPSGTKPKVQIPLHKKNQDSSSLLDLGLGLILVIFRVIFISTVVFGLITFYWTTRLLRIDNAFPPVLLKGMNLFSIEV